MLTKTIFLASVTLFATTVFAAGQAAVDNVWWQVSSLTRTCTETIITTNTYCNYTFDVSITDNNQVQQSLNHISVPVKGTLMSPQGADWKAVSFGRADNIWPATVAEGWYIQWNLDSDQDLVYFSVQRIDLGQYVVFTWSSVKELSSFGPTDRLHAGSPIGSQNK